MGGSANICIQYNDGSRDSYMAYNEGMTVVANHTSVLLMKDAVEQDKQVKKIVERESSYEGSCKVRVGLAPAWYGLVFIDLAGKKLWSCQGYIGVRKLNSIKWQPWQKDYFDNVKELVENKMVHKFEIDIDNGVLFKPKDMKVTDLPLVTEEDLNLIQLKEKVRYRELIHDCPNYTFLVAPNDWEDYDLGCDPDISWSDFYDMIFNEYDLSDKEKEVWEEYVADKDY